MPIRQLKPKSGKKKATGFTTRNFGNEPAQPKSIASKRSRALHRDSDADSWLSRKTSDVKRLPARRPRLDAPGNAAARSLLVFLIKTGFVLAGLGGAVAVLAFFVYSRDLPDPNRIIERDVAQSTRIYDRTGEKLLYEIHGTERRTLIDLSDIPQYAIDATIAIEDKNFFRHRGLSIPNLIKAVLLEVMSKVGLYRGLVPGGSTLTQQFIKNAVLTTEKSYERKIKELILANRLEKKFSKEDILKLYFNEIPYGSTAYGIETAAHIYFDKSATNLTIAEAALLAALPQAPSYYSPYGSHLDELIGRQQYVLDLMVEQGYLTEEQAETAKNEELVFKRRREDITAPHFVFMVREELSERYGERLVETGGLKIITTLDLDKQTTAEEAINGVAERNAEQWNANNAALVTIDVATGEILALVGSKDFFDDEIDGQVNVATSLRQPGSSLKPLIYAEAFNQGYRPETTVYDIVTSFAASGRDYRPHNYDLAERGPVSLRQALQGSLNIPAVKMLYLIGVNRAVELAQELGYSSLTDPSRYGLSLVLGGGEVSLLDHTNAYASFAREGIYKPPTSVLKVELNDGTILEEHRETEGTRALPREATRILSDVLTDNNARAYVFGANNYLTLPGRPVAAKTGTTNDYRDAWTVGYTPGIATGVWVGNADNTEMTRGAAGGVVAAPIWQQYMSSILSASPVQGFTKPEPLPPCAKPMLCGGTGERLVTINTETGKLAGPYTPESKIKEVAFRETHSILHYVDRNDPDGPIPENPGTDPQYLLWEEPILAWAEEQGFINQEPPTEVDNIYRPEDQPSISWSLPQNNTIISDATTVFSVNATAPRGVREVRYYANDVLVGSTTQSPFEFNFSVSPATPNGEYTMTAIAADDIGNEARASIDLVLDVPRGADEWRIVWKNIVANASYTASELPAVLQLSISNPERVSKIDLYRSSGGNRNFLGTLQVHNTSDLSLDWEEPTEPGAYSLLLIVTTAENTVYNLPGTTFTLIADE